MSFETATRLVQSLEGLAFSTYFFSHGCQNLLDISNYVTIKDCFNKIISADITVNYLCFIHADFGAVVPFHCSLSLLLSERVEKRVTEIVNSFAKRRKFTRLFCFKTILQMFGKKYCCTLISAEN